MSISQGQWLDETVRGETEHVIRLCVAAATVMTLLANPLSGVAQPFVSRSPRRSRGFTIKPGHDTNNIDSGSNANMLEVCFLLADVTRTTHAKGSNALRNGRFDPFTKRVLLNKS